MVRFEADSLETSLGRINYLETGMHCVQTVHTLGGAICWGDLSSHLCCETAI